MCAINPRAREVRSGLRSIVLESRTCNIMEIASILPLGTERSDMQSQLLSRFLSTYVIDNDEVLTLFIRQAAQMASNSGEILILCIDQTPRYRIDSLSLWFLSASAAELFLFYGVFKRVRET